eukprot:NODE_441_length_7368_cov_0.136195.p2 type:complete len:597 gc:universal NODE_441_length_7368_cov_0.136195:4906-6696(+)
MDLMAEPDESETLEEIDFLNSQLSVENIKRVQDANGQIKDTTMTEAPVPGHDTAEENFKESIDSTNRLLVDPTPLMLPGFTIDQFREIQLMDSSTEEATRAGMDEQPPLEKGFDRERHLITVGGRIVMPRVLVPTALMFAHCHRAHANTESVLKELDGFYWPKKAEEIRHFVSRCFWCRVFKSNNMGIGYYTRTPPTMPWECAAIDVLYLIEEERPDGSAVSKIFVFADVLTGWVRLIPIPDETAKSVAIAMLQVVKCGRHPKHILSDNASYFRALHKSASDWKLNGHVETTFHFCTPYLHHSNPAERLNREVLTLLKIHCKYSADGSERASPWTEQLDLVESIINHRKMGKKPSPSSLQFLAIDVNEMSEPVTRDEREGVARIWNRQRKAVDEFRAQKYADAISKAAKRNHTRKNTSDLVVGQLVVYCPDVGKKTKMGSNATGPYVITAKNGPYVALEHIQNRSDALTVSEHQVKLVHEIEYDLGAQQLREGEVLNPTAERGRQELARTRIIRAGGKASVEKCNLGGMRRVPEVPEVALMSTEGYGAVIRRIRYEPLVGRNTDTPDELIGEPNNVPIKEVTGNHKKVGSPRTHHD